VLPSSPQPRPYFGQLFLWDGIGLVPITIGFFAIPEIIDLAVPEAARRTAVILDWIVGHLIAICLLGFTLDGALCTFLSLKVGRLERRPIALAMTAGMAAFIEVLFVRVLHVPFPPGQLLVWLGVV